MTYIDDLIGDVLKSLVENGFGDNTIVTLIGDHGWMLGENQVRIRIMNQIYTTCKIFGRFKNDM